MNASYSGQESFFQKKALAKPDNLNSVPVWDPHGERRCGSGKLLSDLQCTQNKISLKKNTKSLHTFLFALTCICLMYEIMKIYNPKTFCNFTFESKISPTIPLL